MDNKEFGNHLGQIVIDNLANLKPIEGTGIKTSQVKFEYAYNHDDEDKLAEAQQVMEIWNNQGDKTAATEKAKQLGLNSVYHASSIVARVKRGASGKMELNALRAGGLAFVTAPYEMFSENGLYIKENSPYDTTFLVTGNSGYIPSAEAYDYGSYEAHTGYFAKGTAEKLAEEFVRLLGEVK